MYNVLALKTLKDCRTVMSRAKARGEDEIYRAVFKRACEIAGREAEDPLDPIVAAFHETLAAYEQILSEKNGRNQPAGRTRQKIENKGVRQSLIEWTRQKQPSSGFTLLVERGMPEFTGEFIVARFPSRFPEDVVALARERLQAHSVPIPAPE
jgi:hypothetical protein